MNKKKILIVLLSLTLCLGILTGCGAAGETDSKPASSAAPVSDGQPRCYTAEDLEGLISGLEDVAVLGGLEAGEFGGAGVLGYFGDPGRHPGDRGAGLQHPVQRHRHLDRHRRRRGAGPNTWGRSSRARRGRR